MNREAIEAGLGACLLTDAEMQLGWKKWRRFEDPFEEWE